MGKKPSKSRTQPVPKPVRSRSKNSFDYTRFRIDHANKFVIATVILSRLFVVTVFKNISHPLFWADESMTAMGTERVLVFGYPKGA